MASVRAIKRRIKSAKNIAQITKAMQMVAASKMRKAQSQALATRPYASGLYNVVSDLRGKTDINSHPLMRVAESTEREALIIIAPDKGLCGGLVTNLARSIVKGTEKKPYVIAVGKKGRDATIRLGLEVEAYFEMGISQPKYEIVIPIAQIIIEGFISGKYSKVDIAYTHFENTLSQHPSQRTLLPINISQTSDTEIAKQALSEYLFEPSPETVLESLLPHYVEMEIYQIILESYASEQSARMMAMKNASDNAKDIIGELTLTYNKVRQTLITNEIADIATAAITVGKS